MSFTAEHPAPYPEVNALLRELLESARAVLGEHFVGMYLFGSLTSGDFDRHSDIDVAVVTDEDVGNETFSALRSMHARLAALDSPWATELEVSYIPRHALRRHDPAHSLHPHVDRGAGQSLSLARHDSDWVVQRHVLRERAVVLAGPPPQTLIDPVSPDDLGRAMLEILNGWWAPMLDDPARLKGRGYQSYAVLSMCRVLYTLQHGTIVSKQSAARWARATLDARWRELIEGAWDGRQNSQSEATAEDVSGTQELIRYAVERGRQSAIGDCLSRV